MLDVLGDDYISQHVVQSYREYVEKTSYRIYMSSMFGELAGMIAGSPVERKWSDILADLDDTNDDRDQESEQQIRTRILSKLNGRGGAEE